LFVGGELGGIALLDQARNKITEGATNEFGDQLIAPFLGRKFQADALGYVHGESQIAKASKCCQLLVLHNSLAGVLCEGFMGTQLKSEMKRVSARFAAEVESGAVKRNRTFVGQADHLLDVYMLVTDTFRHDDLDTLRDDLQAARHQALLLAAETKAPYKTK